MEISKNRNKYFDNICKFLLKNSGLLIIIDYGYVTLPEHSTLQSIKLHKKTKLLIKPARVVNKGLQPNLLSIVIDGGKIDGIKKDQAVLTPKGVIGKTIEAAAIFKIIF